MMGVNGSSKFSLGSVLIATLQAFSGTDAFDQAIG